MNWQRGFRCIALLSALSFFSPSLLAQNCSNNQAPLANAGPDRSGNVGVAMNFTGSGTDSDGTITAYWFNFGDGSFASWQTSPLASHSFASAGTFSVRLWVKDNCGAMSASDTAIVTITQAPANPCANNTAPIANAGPDRAGNPNLPLLLTGYASTDVQNNISHYWWNFGDGQYTGWQTSAGVSHAFANTGTYSVRLWVKDSCGAMSAADTVIVNIVNPNPCAGNTPPNAVITSPSSGLVNQSLNFSGLSSSDTTGTIQSYAWNFGDGQSANGVNVSHSYSSAGNKTVTLTLTDSCGAQGSMTRTIVISNPYPCAGNQQPIAQASANPTIANINQSISFSAAGSSDPNGSITSYVWNFGDGTSGSGLNASHAYASAGSFNVILTVTDNCGATATKTISVSISNPNIGIVVSRLTHVDAQTGHETWTIIQDGEEIELGLRVKFEAPQFTAGANLISWSFMDSTGSNQPAPIHAYNNPGSYTVQLLAYDQNWVPHTYTKTLHVAAGMELIGTVPGTQWAGPNPAIEFVNDVAWVVGRSYPSGAVRTIDFQNPNAPVVLDEASIPGPSFFEIAVSPELVAAVGQTQIYLFNANSPSNLDSLQSPLIMSGSTCPPNIYGVYSAAFATQRYLYVGRGVCGLEIYDLQNPTQPILAATNTAVGVVGRDMKVVGTRAYVATGYQGTPNHPPRVKILDISNPLNPIVMGEVPLQWEAFSILVQDSSLVIVENNNQVVGGLTIFDLSQNPFQPQLKSHFGYVSGVDNYINAVIDGQYVFATEGLGSIHKINIMHLENPYLVDEVDAGGVSIGALAVHWNEVIVGSVGTSGGSSTVNRVRKELP